MIKIGKRYNFPAKVSNGIVMKTKSGLLSAVDDEYAYFIDKGNNEWKVPLKFIKECCYD